MQTIEEMQAHYKAVRERLRYTPPQKPIIIQPVMLLAPEPEPEPELEPEPEKPKMPRLFIPLTPAQAILKEIAIKHEMTAKDITGQSRKWKYTKARQEAAYEIKKRLNLSLPMVGIILGRRDHTTILHAVRQHAKRYNLPLLTVPKQIAVHSDCIKKEIPDESLGSSI